MVLRILFKKKLFQEEDIHTLDQSALTTVDIASIFKENVNATNQNPTKIKTEENIASVETVKVIELEDITLLTQRDTSSDEVNACIRYSEIFQHKLNDNIVFNMAFPNTNKEIPFEEVTLMSDTNTSFAEIYVLDTDEHNLNNQIDFTYHLNTACYRETELDTFAEQTSAKVLPRNEGAQPENGGHNNKGRTKVAVKENEDIRFVVQKQENETITKIVDSIADSGASISKSHIFR